MQAACFWDAFPQRGASPKTVKFFVVLAFCHLWESCVFRDQSLTFCQKWGPEWESLKMPASPASSKMSQTVIFGNCDVTDPALARNLDGCLSLLQRTVSLYVVLRLHYNQQQTIVKNNTRWSWINCVPSENKPNQKNDLRLFSFCLLICNSFWIG